MGVSPGHALVVDDDDSIREVVALTLELVGGWRVSVANGGAAALAMIRGERPDVVVLDVMMPGMDGLEVVERLRNDEATADLPVVLMTAKATTGDEREWQGLGVAGVIAKPFDPMSFADRLGELLEASAGPGSPSAGPTC